MNVLREHVEPQLFVRFVICLLAHVITIVVLVLQVIVLVADNINIYKNKGQLLLN